MAKKRKQNTYMIALQVQIVLRPTVYLEVIAGSVHEALEQTRKATRNKGWSDTVASDFLDECRTDLPGEFSGQFAAAKVKAISCGRASQYHSDAECKLCQEVSKGRASAHGVKASAEMPVTGARARWDYRLDKE